MCFLFSSVHHIDNNVHIEIMHPNENYGYYMLTGTQVRSQPKWKTLITAWPPVIWIAVIFAIIAVGAAVHIIATYQKNKKVTILRCLITN